MAAGLSLAGMQEHSQKVADRPYLNGRLVGMGAFQLGLLRCMQGASKEK